MNKTALIPRPAVSLGFFPTPLCEMKRLARHLGGPRLLIKRDDQTGLAFGGNKTRKLEYLLGEAVQGKHDCVITAGSAQSNHCRQTAAAAAQLGLGCHLVLGGSAPTIFNGNLLLDGLLGAVIHWSGEDRKGERIPEIASALRADGLNPFVIPYGGSNATGAMGFVSAMMELEDQIEGGPPLDAIIFASSSGGTQAGMSVGASLLGRKTPLVGIEVDKGEVGEGGVLEKISHLAKATATILGREAIYQPRDFVLKRDYVGGGYGVIGDLEREAISLAARFEGILLDPVYTARAFGGMLDMISRGDFSRNETVLFWHTGGAPALFACAEELSR